VSMHRAPYKHHTEAPAVGSSNKHQLC
jgi:hypothetical protein